MKTLAAAAFFMVVSHVLSAHLPIRDSLTRRIGERGFLILYSALSMAALVWLGWAYVHAPYVEVWGRNLHHIWVPILIMPMATFLICAAVAESNPLREGLLPGGYRHAPIRGVFRITRHPVAWASALWALAHLAPNGDLASVILFGALGGLALGGAWSMDRKAARRLGDSWAACASSSPYVPFAAILAGRQKCVWSEIGVGRCVSGVLLYCALLYMHGSLFGYPIIPLFFW
ncbi:NnrU protein [Azospirillaceae bacterium]